MLPLVFVGFEKQTSGNFPVVQRLRICASTAGGTGSILGSGTKTLYAMWYSQKPKQKTEQNTVNHCVV